MCRVSVGFAVGYNLAFREHQRPHNIKEGVCIMRRLPAPEEGKLGEAGQKLEELKGALDKPDTQQR